jgi:hypothetical protein
MTCGTDTTIDGVGNQCANYFMATGVSYTYTGHSPIQLGGPYSPIQPSQYAGLIGISEIEGTIWLLFTITNGTSWFNQNAAFVIVHVICPPVTTGEKSYSVDPSGMTCSRPDQCPAPNVINSSGQCIPPETYTITLYGGTTTEPGTFLPFMASVTNKDGKPPTSPVTVKISLKVDPTSGGHDHGDSARPRGGIANVGSCPSDDTCWSVDTPANNGVIVFNFNAPDASGTHSISATCDKCSNTATAKVNVKVDGLSTLTASPMYELVGAVTGKHTDNHYLSELASANLLDLVDRYNKAYPTGPVLSLNDASLVWGGKFDVSGTWTGAHAEHRRGVVIDIRANQLPTAIPLSRFSNFKKLAAKSGGAFADLHCAFPSRFSWACWADTGPNRHFHVRLLGQKVAQ